QVEGALRVEGGLQDRRTALEEGGQEGLVERGGVEQRCADQRDLVLRDIYIYKYVDRVPGQVVMGQDRPAGVTGGAGRIHDHRDVVTGHRHVDRDRRSAVDELLQRVVGRLGGGPGHDPHL